MLKGFSFIKSNPNNFHKANLKMVTEGLDTHLFSNPPPPPKFQESIASLLPKGLVIIYFILLYHQNCNNKLSIEVLKPNKY